MQGQNLTGCLILHINEGKLKQALKTNKNEKKLLNEGLQVKGKARQATKLRESIR